MSGPWRRDFDAARDPYTARNALGITSTGGGGGSTDWADITGKPSTFPPTLPIAQSGVTNLTTDLAAKADLVSPTFTGDPKAPTPATADNDTSIATTAYVKAQGYVSGGPYQPLDGDLTAIAALAGTNTIYYRSGTDTWSAVTMGGNMTFSGGVLNSTGGGGGTPGGSNTQVQYNNSGAFGGSANMAWNNATSVFTVTGQIVQALGSATGILAGGSVQAASFKCTGTNAVLGPETSGTVALRGGGFAVSTNQFLLTAAGAVTVPGPITLTSQLTVANGGTGLTSATAYAVQCGGTTSTGAHQSIASVGTSGQVLTSNGAGALPTFQTAAGGGSGLLASGTVTAAATLDINLSTFTSYLIIEIHIYEFIPASNSVPLYMLFSTNGGSSYDTSGYNYIVMLAVDDSGTVNATGSGSAPQIAVSPASNSNASTAGSDLIITLHGRTNAALWTRASWHGGAVDDAARTRAFNGSGAREAAQITNAVRFLFSSGNIASGKYAVYGK